MAKVKKPVLTPPPDRLLSQADVNQLRYAEKQRGITPTAKSMTAQYLTSGIKEAPFQERGIAVNPEQHGMIDWSNYDGTSFQHVSDGQSLQDIQAANQSGWELAAYGTGRMLNRAVTEVAKLVPLTGGLLTAIGENIYDGVTGKDEHNFMETFVNNAGIKLLDEVSEDINNTMPVHVLDAVKNGNLWDNITSGSFWANEGADGLGFLLAMFAPGAALKGLNIGKHTMSGTSKMMSATGISKTSFEGARQLTRLGLSSGNIDSFAITAVNTMAEAGAEAGGAMREFEKEIPALKQKHMNQRYSELTKMYESGDISEDAYVKAVNNLEVEVDEMLKEQKGLLGRDIFAANLAILVGPNALQTKLLFGEGKRSFVKSLNQPKTWKSAGKGLGLGIASEGFFEEGMQSTVEPLFTEKAKKGELKKGSLGLKDFSLGEVVDGYMDMIGSVDGQKAVFLGSLMGGVMNSFGQVKEDKRSYSYSMAVNQHLSGSISQIKSTLDNLYVKDKEGKVVYKEGKPVLNNVSAEKLGYHHVANKMGIDMLTEAEGDALTTKALYDVEVAQTALSFAILGESGHSAMNHYVDTQIDNIKESDKIPDGVKKDKIAEIEKMRGDLHKQYTRAKEEADAFDSVNGFLPTPLIRTNEDRSVYNQYVSDAKHEYLQNRLFSAQVGDLIKETESTYEDLNTKYQEVKGNTDELNEDGSVKEPEVPAHLKKMSDEIASLTKFKKDLDQHYIENLNNESYWYNKYQGDYKERAVYLNRRKAKSKEYSVVLEELKKVETIGDVDKIKYDNPDYADDLRQAKRQRRAEITKKQVETIAKTRKDNEKVTDNTEQLRESDRAEYTAQLENLLESYSMLEIERPDLIDNFAMMGMTESDLKMAMETIDTHTTLSADKLADLIFTNIINELNTVNSDSNIPVVTTEEVKPEVTEEEIVEEDVVNEELTDEQSWSASDNASIKNNPLLESQEELPLFEVTWDIDNEIVQETEETTPDEVKPTEIVREGELTLFDGIEDLTEDAPLTANVIPLKKEVTQSKEKAVPVSNQTEIDFNTIEQETSNDDVVVQQNIISDNVVTPSYTTNLILSNVSGDAMNYIYSRRDKSKVPMTVGKIEKPSNLESTPYTYQKYAYELYEQILNGELTIDNISPYKFETLLHILPLTIDVKDGDSVLNFRINGALPNNVTQNEHGEIIVNSSTLNRFQKEALPLRFQIITAMLSGNKDINIEFSKQVNGYLNINFDVDANGRFQYDETIDDNGRIVNKTTPRKVYSNMFELEDFQGLTEQQKIEKFKKDFRYVNLAGVALNYQGTVTDSSIKLAPGSVILRMPTLNGTILPIEMSYKKFTDDEADMLVDIMSVIMEKNIDPRNIQFNDFLDMLDGEERNIIEDTYGLLIDALYDVPTVDGVTLDYFLSSIVHTSNNDKSLLQVHENRVRFGTLMNIVDKNNILHGLDSLTLEDLDTDPDKRQLLKEYLKLIKHNTKKDLLNSDSYIKYLMTNGNLVTTIKPNARVFVDTPVSSDGVAGKTVSPTIYVGSNVTVGNNKTPFTPTVSEGFMDSFEMTPDSVIPLFNVNVENTSHLDVTGNIISESAIETESESRVEVVENAGETEITKTVESNVVKESVQPEKVVDTFDFNSLDKRQKVRAISNMLSYLNMPKTAEVMQRIKTEEGALALFNELAQSIRSASDFTGGLDKICDV